MTHHVVGKMATMSSGQVLYLSVFYNSYESYTVMSQNAVAGVSKFACKHEESEFSGRHGAVNWSVPESEEQSD